MDYPWAVPGVKVVRVSDDGVFFDDTGPKKTDPEVGGIYTINWVDVDVDGVWIGFEECDQDDCWEAYEFRPLHDLKSDVAKFTQLLNTTDEVVDA